MVELELPYGKDFLKFELQKKNLVLVAKPRAVPGAREVQDEVERALSNPIGCDRLSEMAKPGLKVTIVVDDVTRPTPAHLLIPSVVKELHRAGVKDDDISVVVGRGGHRKMTEQEVKEKVGQEEYERLSVEVHEPTDHRELKALGETSHGTPLWINKTFMEAGLKIGIGGILPHVFAGYGGGAKIVLPGVSSVEGIKYNHNILSPRARLRILDGNPLREDMEEAAERVGLNFKIDVVQNSEHEIVKIFAGQVKKEHREGVKAFNEIFEVKVPEPVDAVITSANPKDITFSQGTAHTLAAVEPALKRGGTIVVASRAYEGFTFDKDFEEMWKARLTKEDIEERIKSGNIREANYFYCLADIRRFYDVLVISEGITDDDVLQAGFVPASTIDEALGKVFSKHGKDAKIAFVPYGFQTLLSPAQ